MANSEENAKLLSANILIYGMGMMGASLARALKKQPAFKGTITGVVRTEKSAAFIKNSGLADRVLVSPTLEAVRDMDWSGFELAVLGLPVRSVEKLMEFLPPFQGVVTDMSSTRRDVQAAARKRNDLRFVGAHPMCGSEDSGPSAYVEDLYTDRLCILTPSYVDAKDEERKKRMLADTEIVDGFWQIVGMRTYRLDPDSHDEMLAYLSHSPHVISSILTLWAESNSVVGDSTRQSPMPITGGGFKGMSRIAGSNPEMWSDIMETNRDNIIASLKGFIDELHDVIGKLENAPRKDWLEWFERSRRARNRLCGFPEDR